MSLVTLPAPISYPPRFGFETSSIPGFSAIVLDEAGEYCGAVFYVPKTGTITKIGWRTGTVTNADDVVVSLETVSATTGAPTGTNYGGSAGTTVALVNTDDNLWFWTTLTTPATATENDIVAIKIAITFVDGSLAISFAVSFMGATAFPYAFQFVASTFFKIVTVQPNFAVEYSDGSRPYMYTLPILTQSSTSFGTGSVPDERGNRFKVPFACLVTGIVLKGLLATSAQTFAVKIYDSADTVIASKTAIDNDIFSTNTASGLSILFDTPVVLQPNTLYRLTYLPETASSPISFYHSIVDSGGTLESFPGGVEWYHTERTNAGAWTDIQTQVSHIGLIIDQLGDDIVAGDPVRPQSSLQVIGRRR